MKDKRLQIFRSLFLLLTAVGMLAVTSCNNNPTEELPATVAAYTNLEDLDGHTVGVVTGSTMDMMMGDTVNFPNITLVRFDTPSKLINSVEKGETDCGIVDTIQLLAHKLPKHGLAIDFTLSGGFDVAAAFNLNDKKLCEQFNDFIIQVKSDGTLDSMLAHWTSERIDTVNLPAFPELEDLKGHPLEVATLSDNMPFSFYRKNGWIGFEIELITQFGVFINRPVHFSGYNFDEVLPALLSHKADMVAANLFITPDRSKRVLYSNPYYFCKTSCFSKARE
ncbi:MAG: transporter substrate-binding domain-containing protein [Bacteroidales bacterium]|nr:transporter substrate-binding domain-containing protein [Bacteroidales bacterium]